MIAHLSYVMCDECGNPAELADNAKEARAEARRQGFKHMGQRDICRECISKQTGEETCNVCGVTHPLAERFSHYPWARCDDVR